MQVAELPITLQGRIWMNAGESNLGGHGRVALLAGIADTGSISRAAKAMRISYKAAWDAIDQMNNLAGEPLVVRSAGGRGGGSTQVTPRGRRLIDNFQRLETAHRRFVEQLSQQAAGMADDILMLRRLGMRTSARNQFSGEVTAIAQGAVNDEVELRIAGGQHIIATITRESTSALGLAIGSDAFALIKASSVIILTDSSNVRFSARNHLNGTVVTLLPGAVNTEVVLELAGGGRIAAIITNESSRVLGLAEGATASALFKASNVIIAATE